MAKEIIKDLPIGGKAEEALRILANIGVENIFLSRATLERILSEFGLTPREIRPLVLLFAKKNGGEQGSKSGRDNGENAA